MRSLPVVTIVGVLLVVLAGCGRPEPAQPSEGPREGSIGRPQAFPCEEAVEYGYGERTPLGTSAQQAVDEYGRKREAPMTGAHSSLTVLGVAADARPSIAMSFEYSGGAVTYSGDCGSHHLSIPVTVTAALSTGQTWTAPAVLSIRQNLDTTVRLAPTTQAPFYLIARMAGAHTDVQLEPAGQAQPVLFSTRCGISVDAQVRREFNTDLATLVQQSQPARLACSTAGGSRAAADLATFTIALAERDEEACTPYSPRSDPPQEFSFGLNVGASWSADLLQGKATLGRDSGVPLMRYTVSGKARGDAALAQLLPCAARDDNVSVQIEGGIRGASARRREPGTVTFYFSCEDLAVRCTTE